MGRLDAGAAPLPLGKIGKVLAMFGIRVNQVDAPPALASGRRGRDYE